MVKFQNLQKHCEYILKYLEPAVDDLTGMENYFVLCEYYAYASRKVKIQTSHLQPTTGC